jgi:hypothetical protein
MWTLSRKYLRLYTCRPADGISPAPVLINAPVTYRRPAVYKQLKADMNYTMEGAVNGKIPPLGGVKQSSKVSTFIGLIGHNIHSWSFPKVSMWAEGSAGVI